MERMLVTALEIDGPAGPATEGARRATGVAGPAGPSRATPPDPEVPARGERRTFTAEYRLGILKQADACKKPGEVGALLRREGLYSSLLVNWRRHREQDARQEMRGRRRGPKPRVVDPRVKQLRRRIANSSESSRERKRSSRSKKKLPSSWGSP